MNKSKEYIDKERKLEKIRETLIEEGFFDDGQTGEWIVSFAERLIDKINTAYRKGYKEGQREVKAVDGKTD